MHMPMYMHIYARMQLALRARNGFGDLITGLYYGIVLQDYITRLYYGIILRDYIAVFDYRIILRDYVTESC